MASVFLSYDRDDADKARSVAQALEKAGHSVWWDFHVRGGAQFSKVIENALKAADAVVVLWSKNSIESGWVRDEATTGRDAGKLVPVTIDGTEAPLGFRQYQSIGFSRWKGRSRTAEFQQLLHAIGALSGGLVSTPSPANSGASWLSVPRPRLVVGLVVFVIVIGGAFALWRIAGRSSIPVVTVAAADSSSASSSLARDLFVKLGQLQAADPDALQIIESTVRTRPDFTFQVSASPTDNRAAANLALVGRNRTLLWSKDFERPQAESSELRHQLALTAARVLECASEAVTDRGSQLDQGTLKLYLSGCALSDLAWTNFRALVPTFREVTRRAPRFEDGWAKLVETEAYVMGWETIPADSPEGRTLRADIAAARKLNPRMAEAYWAEWVLLGEPEVALAAELVERATRDNPDEPLILGIRATFLSRVGRLNEALEAIKRGADRSPLAGDATAGYAVALTYAGQLDAALQELEKAERLWPGTPAVTDARFRVHLRYGDPRQALSIVRSGVNPDYARFEPFLLARIDPTKNNIDRAIADAKAQVAQSPRGTGWLFLTLAHFGREEEIYSVLEKLPKTRPVYAAEMFFRPDFHRFRHDIRFMRLAKNLGLADYWRTSGKWPDFCFEPDLPYDCKAEAAKLS